MCARRSVEDGAKGWEDAYRELELNIIMGRLRPRERLVEDDIISRTGMTRHAVRRAFDELAKTGIVVRQPNKGVQVRDYTAEEAEELYEIRECLELQAASHFTEPAHPDVVAELTELASRHRQAVRGNNFTEAFAANNSFHEALYRAGGNKQLAAAIRHYTFVTHPIRTRSFPSNEQREMYIAEHFEMISAIAKGNWKGLKSLIRRHLGRVKKGYKASVVRE